MSLKRILGLALIAALVFPISACDEENGVQPPPPKPQITTVTHYTKKFAKLPSGQEIQTGLQDNDVHEILVTSTNKLWIGNQGGIAVYDDFTSTNRSGAFDQNTKPAGLPNPKVRTMVELNGIIYAGTWGGGIGVYDIALGDSSWTTLDVSDGLINNTVGAIVIDEGNLVIATNGGVSMYDPVADTWESYIREDSEGARGDLLDGYVSDVAVAQTPRGKEYWYMPRWESGIDAGDEDEHGITVARGDFDASPVTVTLSPTKDNSIYEDAAGSLSNGVGELLMSGMSPNLEARTALIHFDVSSIPADATVSSVRLRLRATLDDFDQAVVTLRRAQSDWGEGLSMAIGDPTVGAPATTGDATWLHTFYPDSFWRKKGGDYPNEASRAIGVRNVGTYTWQGGTMADDVQYWAQNPSSNFGWAIVNNDSLKAFASREYGAPQFRPTLEITYAKYSYLHTENSDLSEPNVNDILYDEVEDVFWLAMSRTGLARVDVVNSKWTYYTTDDGLPSNVIYSIVKLDGALWLGTQNGLAREIAPGTFRGYNRGGGIPADRVRKVHSDDGARLWLGLIEAGAARVNPLSAE